MGDDAGTAPAQLLARLLEYLDVPARAQEQVGGKQSAE
jgi:hypothetical protein